MGNTTDQKTIILNPFLQITHSPNGTLTNIFPSTGGAREGCVLTAILFNFCMNDLAASLETEDFAALC